MDKDTTYQMYATDTIKNIPIEHAQYLINLFMQEAAVNMGATVDEATLERVIYHVMKDFGYLPVCSVASAFIRGSLGHFGAGRLVPRTIHGWLTETSEDFNRKRKTEEQKRIGEDLKVSFNLRKYPLGRAIIVKMDWLTSGAITEAQWDNDIPLKRVAEILAEGRTPQLTDFGIYT